METLIPFKIVVPYEEVPSESYETPISKLDNFKYIVPTTCGKVQKLLTEINKSYSNEQVSSFQLQLNNIALLPLEYIDFVSEDLKKEIERKFVNKIHLGSIYEKLPQGIYTEIHKATDKIKSKFSSDLIRLIRSLPYKKAELELLSYTENSYNTSSEDEKSTNISKKLDVSTETPIATTEILYNEKLEEELNLESKLSEFLSFNKSLKIKLENKDDHNNTQKSFEEELLKFEKFWKAYIPEDILSSLITSLSSPWKGKREVEIKLENLIKKETLFNQIFVSSSESSLGNKVSFQSFEINVLTALGVSKEILKEYHTKVKTLTKEFIRLKLVF